MQATLSRNEPERLEALDRYKILETPAENSFNDLVRLAAQITATPMSLVSFVGRDRQLFKGRYGIELTETPRRLSFCAHTILHPEDLMEVPDTTRDPRFVDNELVTGPPFLRYYLGAPLVTPDSYALGALCVLDTRPRTLTAEQKNALRSLSSQVMTQLELRHRIAALREHEERFRVLFETSPVSTFVIDPQTRRILDCNDQATQSLGYNREELCKLSIPDIDVQQTPEDIAHHIAEIIQRRHLTFETRHRTRSGELRDVLVTARSLQLQGRSVLYVSSIDVSDSKRAQEALRDNEVRLRLAIEASERRAFHLQILQQASARLLLGQHPVALLRDIYPKIAQSFGADAFVFCQADPHSGQLQLEASAGFPEDQQHTLETLCNGAVHAKPAEACLPIIATRIQTTDADNHRFLRELGFRSYLYYPLSVNRRLHGALAFASRQRYDYDPMDLDFFNTVASTLAEALERRRLEAELEHHAADLERIVQQRTASLQEMIAELEHFSYTITHDMRAPLRAMHGMSRFLLEENDSCTNAERLDYLHRIAEAADRMDKLITDALQYSTVVRGELPLCAVDSEALLRGILQSYPEFQPPHAHIEVESPLPTVLANEAGLTQCFSNLLANAVKFVHPGQSAEVRVWAEEVEGNRAPDATPEGESKPSATSLSSWHISRQTSSAATPAALRSIPSVRIWFEDRGIGIAKEYHDKIWVMFQRLSKSYDGTGIGLTLVRKAVERMGGRVGVESEPGSGSRFYVELRRAD